MAQSSILQWTHLRLARSISTIWMRRWCTSWASITPNWLIGTKVETSDWPTSMVTSWKTCWSKLSQCGVLELVRAFHCAIYCAANRFLWNFSRSLEMTKRFTITSCKKKIRKCSTSRLRSATCSTACHFSCRSSCHLSLILQEEFKLSFTPLVDFWYWHFSFQLGRIERPANHSRSCPYYI